MTATNPHPLANPLTDRPIGNVNFGDMLNGYYFKADKNAKLPESDFDFAAFMAQQNELHVPDTSPESFHVDSGYGWSMKNGVKTLEFTGRNSDSWNDCGAFNPFQCPQMQYNMSKAEVERLHQLKQKDAELCACMSDFQKQQLDAFMNTFGKTKFEDEEDG